MATSNDPLTFFVLEAGECLERLDGILAGAGPAGPDSAEFVRFARTLRGASIMHRLTGFGDLASGVERAGRALRDGATRWSPALAAALVAAVDDLKILLHNLRIWGPNEEARAKRRLADLARFMPAAEEASPRVQSGGGFAYLANEMTETAAALEPLTKPGGGAPASSLQAALAKVRTLRGVAAVHDVPPVPEVLDAVERLTRSLEIADGTPNAAQTALLSAGAALLRRTSGDLRALGRSVAGTPEERRFNAAREALVATTMDADRIVPIDELFYGDGGAGVVAPTARPPTTPAERFRLEVVSQAEHLKVLVRDAQSTSGSGVPDRVANDLRLSLQSVRSAAESFGEEDIAGFLTTFTEGHPVFDFLTLNAIDELATLLTDPTGPDRDLAGRMAAMARGRALDAGIAQGLSASAGGVPSPEDRSAHGAAPHAAPPPPPPPPAAVPRPSAAPQPRPPASVQGGGGFAGRDRVRTPTGRALQALLADGIAGISPLDDIPLSEQTPPHSPAIRVSAPIAPASPAPAPAAAAAAAAARHAGAPGGASESTLGQPLHSPVAEHRPSEAERGPGVPGSAGLPPSVVPIEALLYRGESALARARTLGDTLRTDPAPRPDALAELYDLLDLAASA